MRKGDIVLIPFPFTDLSGHKVRPALVLYAAVRGEDCIVAFISSRPQIKIRGFDIEIMSSTKNGLKFDSVLKIEKIATLQKKIVVGKLGTLEAPLLKAVGIKLRTLLRM